MAAVRPLIPHVEDDDESTLISQSSYSQSESGVSTAYSQDDGDDASSFAGTVSSGGSCSVDSIGRMLVQLEYNDESLTDLLIDCRTMDRKEAVCVEQFLPANTCTKKLRIHCGDVTSHRQVFHKVVSGIKGSCINSIEIRDAVFDRQAASWLAPSFVDNQTLKHIEMVKCSFVGSGLGILFVAIQHVKKSIRELTFFRCDWEEHNSDIVASSLPFLGLHSLSLVDINVADDSWSYLIRNIEQCKELIHLDLSSNQLEYGEIFLLAKSLVAQKTVSKLTLSDCDLDHRCMKELAKGLRNHNALTSLDISKNKHIEKGVIYLKDLLKFNNAITTLNVEACGLSKQSKDDIEDGLRYNNSYLKSFFSKATSKAIFGVVDSIEQIDINEIEKQTQNILFEAVSFESEGASPRKKGETKQRRGAQPMPRSPRSPRTPRSSNAKPGAMSPGRNANPTEVRQGTPKRQPPGNGETRRMLL